ncbi:hypothetical protein DVK44_12755 [Streptomyces paludis]|uniref:Uncharacterized protein n=1 Tax=Streptomyces paludis TaxID=2282738 RepID=A0A345HP12_9ACTN|nr:hypothetical protein DVK44_12755 [Streptomyces paludis]
MGTVISASAPSTGVAWRDAPPAGAYGVAVEVFLGDLGAAAQGEQRFAFGAVGDHAHRVDSAAPLFIDLLDGVPQALRPLGQVGGV